MSDVTGRKVSLGLKLAAGFGGLLLVTVALGAVAIFSMVQAQRVSSEVAKEYLPEVKVANDIERHALETMLAIRSYGFTAQENFLKEGQKTLKDLDGLLNEAEILAQKFPKLVKLRENLPTLKTLRLEYVGYVEKTQAANEKMAELRKKMDATAGIFVEEASKYVESQTSKLSEEIAANTANGAMVERANKINQGNKVLDLGNEIRVANFKSQATGDPAFIKAKTGNFDEIETLVLGLLKTTRQQVNIEQLNRVKQAATDYKTDVEGFLVQERLLTELGTARNQTAERFSNIAEETSIRGIETAVKGGDTNEQILAASVLILIIGLLVAVAIGLIIAWALTMNITGPLKIVTNLSNQIARGDFRVEKKAIRSRDELGDMARSFYAMVDGLVIKADVIKRVADGDLTGEIQLASEDDGLGKSLIQMQNALNEILGQVNVAVEQMASGADQVSTASQTLSQGATEQASSLEEISASSNEVHSQSKQNAETSTSANQLAKQASVAAQAGNQQMEGLLTLMERMTKSSEETKKIVKAIDDIAFQVNLLALNANVEAARAGKYGKGFAVVAEEVRNLAVRSAQAVKETTEMVEESIQNIKEVSANSQGTATQLSEIVNIATKVADFLEEITAASQEQARAMGQINGGLEQIDQVTQSNTASAEESASAAEELSSQAQQLKQMVSRFRLKNQEAIRAQAQEVVKARLAQHSYKAALPEKSAPNSPGTKTTGLKPAPSKTINLSDGDFDTF